MEAATRQYQVARVRRVIGAALSACLMAFVLACLGGCVFSETITERIIDSDPSSTIDYDLDPVLINTATATETTDKLPMLAMDETDQLQDVEEELPEFSDTEIPSAGQSAPTPEYNPNAPKAGTAQARPSNTPSTTSQVPGSDGQGEGDDGDWSDVGGTDGDDGGSDDADDDEPGDDGNTDPAEGDSDNPGRTPGGSGDYYSDVPDMDNPEIPEGVSKVVAFGNDAVIVSILTGSADDSALIGCDAQTKQATAQLLANRGMGTVKSIECTEGAPMSASAFKYLVKNVGPDLVYVTEGKNPFSSQQLSELSANSITVYTLPALTSDARIRFCFQVMAQTFEAGGVAGAPARSSEYLDFIGRRLVDKYQSANGGLTGGYDFDEQREVDTGAQDVVTLVVDGWDGQARYANARAGALDSSGGVATATLGSLSSPMNYYLSAGGVLNNAASKKVRKVTNSGRALVWQFATGQLSGDLSNFSSLSASYVDLSSKLTGGLFASSLLCHGSDYMGLGTEDFRALVASSESIASLIRASAQNPNGLYRAYGTITPAGHGSTVGYFPGASADFYVESAIGRGIGGESEIGEGALYDVYVNPKGLCQSGSDDELCSWLAGSPESALEASWAYWKFRNGSQADFEQDVVDFYGTFYGYTISSSDLAAIEAGAAN